MKMLCGLVIFSLLAPCSFAQTNPDPIPVDTEFMKIQDKLNNPKIVALSKQEVDLNSEYSTELQKLPEVQHLRSKFQVEYMDIQKKINALLPPNEAAKYQAWKTLHDVPTAWQYDKSIGKNGAFVPPGYK